MKKIAAMALCLVIAVTLVSCGKNEAQLIHKTYKGEITEIGDDYITIDCSTTNDTEKFMLDEKTLPFSFNLIVGQKVAVESEFYTDDEKPYSAQLITLDERYNKLYTYHVAFANWTDNSKIYTGALNWKTIAISSVQHLPVYKFDTAAELDAFKASYSDILTMDQGLDETPSFDYITAAYNDSFFSGKSLILVYVPASSGSFRFGVNEVYCDDQSLCIYVEQLNNPEAYDCMMAGWFVVAEADKEDIANCVDFDAQLRHPSTGGDIVDADNIRKDICELYLAVLEDLWNVDSGLNDGISQLGIDLSELSHLTEVEKETVMHDFASKHNLPYIAGTWKELCEQGYIDKDNLYWEDGLFFSIKTNEDAVWNLPAIKEGDPVPELTAFDAQKWRSGLGAYYFGQCTAQKNADGTWSYTVGQAAIA